MTDFCRKSTSYSEIPDPYYEGPQGFELVARFIGRMRLPDFIGIVWPIIDPDI